MKDLSVKWESVDLPAKQAIASVELALLAGLRIFAVASFESVYSIRRKENWQVILGKRDFAPLQLIEAHSSCKSCHAKRYSRWARLASAC